MVAGMVDGSSMLSQAYFMELSHIMGGDYDYVHMTPVWKYIDGSVAIHSQTRERDIKPHRSWDSAFISTPEILNQMLVPLDLETTVYNKAAAKAFRTFCDYLSQ